MDYLSVREAYRVAFHKWDACQKQLCERFGCEFAELDQKLLEARKDRRLEPLIQNYAKLGIELDVASDRWDIIQAAQARKTAAAIAQVNRDLANIEC
jgi:hypothetical protein